MLKIILVIIIIIVLIKIFNICFQNYDQFINITNPFVNGLSQFQLGSNLPNQTNLMYMDTSNNNNNYDILDELIADCDYNHVSKPKTKPIFNSNQIIPIPRNKLSKISQDIQIINELRQNKSNKSNKLTKSKYQKIPCKKLNKFFIQSQFSDSYRDVLTVFNYICPDQKILFNLQSLPVITTHYKINNKTPYIFFNLVQHFITQTNNEIKKLPESYDILNNYNNYMPMTSQLKKYTENKGINKFYKEIGVDYNLYADTPPNAPVELIKIIKTTREYTDAETKYIITFVIKKILKSISEQLQITVHFVSKNDPLEGYNMFEDNQQYNSINSPQTIAIEFIFIDGFYTNDFNVDYDCVGTDNHCKNIANISNISNINGDDKYYSFDALGTQSMISNYEIVKEFNKKNREHEIEMNNFNINVPYPIYENPHEAIPYNSNK